MAVYAGIALAHILDKIDGEVWVVGTPSEETNGAKVLMAENGVFPGKKGRGLIQKG